MIVEKAVLGSMVKENYFMGGIKPKRTPICRSYQSMIVLQFLYNEEEMYARSVRCMCEK